ncbi:hypothetical protein ALC60_03704, partial [Trachymyrmex zeteki]
PEISPASIQNRARKGTERTTIAQVRRLNRDFGNPKREGGGRRTAVSTRSTEAEQQKEMALCVLEACTNGPRGEGGFENPWEFPWPF